MKLNELKTKTSHSYQLRLETGNVRFNYVFSPRKKSPEHWAKMRTLQPPSVVSFHKLLVGAHIIYENKKLTVLTTGCLPATRISNTRH